MLVRVSIGNLVPRLVVKETGKIYFFGIWNAASYRKGEKRLSALGGAVELTVNGCIYLANRFNAKDFEQMDARFIVEEEHLLQIQEFFSDRSNSDYFETDPMREVIEELTVEKIADFGVILKREDASLIELRYVKTKPQRLGARTSAREIEGLSTRRLFHLFEMIVPEEVFLKMVEHGTVALLTEDEVATTKGGLKKGVTSTGIELADNIFW